MVITLDNVSFKYIDKPLLKNASVSFTDSDKVGIVGVNGTGKSTLLKLICELEKPNSGRIVKSGNMIINYLEQDPVFEVNKTILECMSNLSTKEHPVNEYEIKSILNKLKLFNHSTLTNNLSGGEKKRLALAKILVSYSDILVLDEPTNHLDNDMIMWLEKYLIRWNKGLIMVTHDRYFLERVCTRMVELDFGNVYSYQANYSKFLELKDLRMEQEVHSQKKLKSILKHELEWVRKSPQARTTKSKSRIDRFNKLNEIEFNNNESIEMSSVKTRLGKKLIEIYNGSKAFGEKTLFSNFNFMLNRSDVVGFVGDNGAGKSTLFKIIMGEEQLDSGEMILGETLKIGYFSQTLDLIDPEIRVIDYIKDKNEIIETIDGAIPAKSLLETFLFDSDMQYSKVKMLSGGEKRRLQLLSVLMTNPNVLILDEPTNDLDIYTLEVLENYLDSFHGPVLIVSHDRYFLDKVCNKLCIFENGGIREAFKTFSEFLEEEKVSFDDVKIKTNTRVRNQMPTKDRNELLALPDIIDKLEKQIAELAKKEVEFTTSYIKLMEILNEKKKIEDELNEKTLRYFELLELKESYN